MSLGEVLHQAPALQKQHGEDRDRGLGHVQDERDGLLQGLRHTRVLSEGRGVP